MWDATGARRMAVERIPDLKVDPHPRTGNELHGDCSTWRGLAHAQSSSSLPTAAAHWCVRKMWQPHALPDLQKRINERGRLTGTCSAKAPHAVLLHPASDTPVWPRPAQRLQIPACMCHGMMSQCIEAALRPVHF
eukprot:356543-Chlamydomonas_euryale.AAC.8